MLFIRLWGLVDSLVCIQDDEDWDITNPFLYRFYLVENFKERNDLVDCCF